MVGNGTTALYVGLQALGLTGKNIVFGSSVCVHVPLAVLFSGNVPVFTDVSESDWCIGYEEVAALKQNLTRLFLFTPMEMQETSKQSIH